MCTVLVRFTPDGPWPVLLAAVRDEFMGRPWEPPAAHWAGHPGVQGGRDRVAGGTWLAVDRSRSAVAALLNGVRLPEPAGGAVRPTRGTLVLSALGAGNATESATDSSTESSTDSSTGGPVPGIADLEALRRYDGFHLLRADRDGVEMWSWDGTDLDRRSLPPGDTIIVNLGANRSDDPLVPYFAPLFGALPDVDPQPGRVPVDAWDGWLDLLRGAGLSRTDPRALIIEHRVDGRSYGSTSASLVGLRRDGASRYDFTATPADPGWFEVPPPDRVTDPGPILD